MQAVGSVRLSRALLDLSSTRPEGVYKDGVLTCISLLLYLGSLMTTLPQALPAPHSRALAGWPLLHLPDSAKELVVQCLDTEDRRRLRLACKATLLLVQSRISRLSLLANSSLFKPGLQRRFLRLHTLGIGCAEDIFDEEAATRLIALSGVCQDAAVLVQDGPFTSVQVLQLTNIHHAAATLLVLACPYVQECSMTSCKEEEGWLGMARNLHGLRRLDSGMCSLGDEEVQLLASCSALTALTAVLDGCSGGTNGGWATLAQMSRLRSLHVHQEWVHLAAGVDLDMRGIAALTQLCVSDSEQDIELDEDWDFGTWAVDAAYDTMQLPAGLVQLDLHQLPKPALQLPALTSLTLHGFEQYAVAAQELSRIAAGCLALVIWMWQSWCLISLVTRHRCWHWRRCMFSAHGQASFHDCARCNCMRPVFLRMLACLMA